MYPRLSPDGTRLAVDIEDGQNDVWVWNFAREVFDRITAGPGIERNPEWTANGARVIYTIVGSPDRLVSQVSDGGSQPEQIYRGDFLQPWKVSKDDRWLFFGERQGGQVRSAALDLRSDPHPVAAVLPSATQVDLSPDGRWIVYQSDESGRNEIYTRSFPALQDRTVVSGGGGTRPVWRRDGSELFFVSQDRNYMSVAVTTVSGHLQAGKPRQLFVHDVLDPSQRSRRAYDVSADGQRFVMTSSTWVGGRDTFAIVLNFDQELRRRLASAP